MFVKKRLLSLGLAICGLLVLPGCLTNIKPTGHTEEWDASYFASNEGTPMDDHSHSDPNSVKTSHIHLDWTIDFEGKKLVGSATHKVWRNPETPEAPFIVDVKDLHITSVQGWGSDGEHELNWHIKKDNDVLGDALIIQMSEGDESVRIQYETSDEGTGLQWLKKEQTSSKKAPFLFSQSQAIHSRTWIPCQDTPGVRVTYSADIRCRSDLEVVMSAERTKSSGGEFSFEMRYPIPCYLIALAAGELEFRSMSPRTGIWAEPSVADAAAWEFADTEKMIEVIEKLYGPYRWGRYDILVLPPSFPFGGMENPLLTFATPTVLAKDRSLTSLIAHELAHSWSGNLVTNATWRDFWLNEGFTVYVEQRVIEELYGKERSNMEIMLSMRDLKEEMSEMHPRDHILHVDLTNRDPDDGFTGVPYDKGAAFLRLIEQTMGRNRFDEFIRSWFDANAFESRTTADFRSKLNQVLDNGPQAWRDQIDVDLWIDGTGLPANAPIPSSPAFDRIDQMVEDWRSNSKSLSEFPVDQWTTQEWLHFLGLQKGAVTFEAMKSLDAAFGLTKKQNSEITCAWLLLAIEADYTPAWDKLRYFLTSQGRRKFLKPLYTEMNEKSNLAAMAREIYREARPLYHAISTTTIDEILK